MKKKEEGSVSPSERLATALSLPKEVVCNLPEITMTGNQTLMIENHKGMVDYGEEIIRINTGCGVLSIAGSGFDILSITDEMIVLCGRIRSMEFTE